MEFCKELSRKENISKILLKLIGNVYETKFSIRLEDWYATYDI
jgi:hypothetical protein